MKVYFHKRRLKRQKPSGCFSILAPPKRDRRIFPVGNMEAEVQLNVWIPKSLMKKIKLKSLDSNISIKDCVTKAIINQLTNINNY